MSLVRTCTKMHLISTALNEFQEVVANEFQEVVANEKPASVIKQ